MLRNMFGGTKCRTIDKVDIFGDSSGVALYRLDGNANDTGGNYHGTETAITYGGGVYERGAVFNGSTAKIDSSLISMGVTNSVSFFASFSDATARGILTYSNGTNKTAVYIDSDLTVQIRINSTWYDITPKTLTLNTMYHFVFSITSNIPTLYINNVLQALTSSAASAVAGTSGLSIGTAFIGSNLYHYGSIDQVRIFNRATTATEIATLYAECAPTSIVDNANPFEDNSLKAMYQFNGNANDLTGVYNGTATNVTYGTGKFGDCAVFNGTSSNVVTTLKMSNTAYSISVLVNTSNSTSFMGIVAAGFNNTDKGFLLERSNVNKVTFYIVNGTNAYGYTSTATLPLNQWVHITLSWDGTTSAGGIKLYFNGTLDNSFTAAVTNASIGTWTEFIKIGVEKTSNYFNGSIDQLRIFNKALTPMEVSSLYTETTPMEEPLASLVDPFKDGSGTALYRLEGNTLDESGNYNGTATSVTYGNGVSGRCGVFNGSNSGIINTFNPTFDDFSLSMWIKVSTLTPTTWGSLIAGNDLASRYSYCLWYNTSATITFTDTTTGDNLTSPNNSITNTADYFHICATKVGTAKKLYINGTLIASNSLGTVSITKPTAGLVIGKYYGSTAQSFNGSIDQARVFNRALTQAEVTQLYTNLA